MLTKLEVQGFKNLLDVSVEFGPFTCIAGANGIGKSNLFDAIEFLSYLANEPLAEAAQRVRSSSGSKGGDPRDLFWDGYRDHQREISIAAEMIVQRNVEDDLGDTARATTTFLRYELTLGYSLPEGEGSVGKLTLEREVLKHINKGEASRHLRFPHSAKNFRNAVLRGQRSGGPFLSTEHRDIGTIINVHGDGGSFGRPQPRSAARAGRTVLSTVTTNDYPTILAARREMQSWRRLALEPSALRAPDSFSAPRTMRTDGRYLAAALFRIASESSKYSFESSIDAEAIYAEVADRLSDLTGVRVESLRVEPDQVREVFTLFLRERGGLRLPARALSEGTLRFLALCVLLEDPTVTGLICMEEPENGIHPANLPAMVKLVQDLAVNPKEAPDQDNPFRQIIINTHSPWVVQLCNPNDLLLADVQPRKTADGKVASSLLLLPFEDSWRAASGGVTFSRADVTSYLAAPSGAQLTLPAEMI
ncbi:AAA family ATPase [Sphaerisporangium sp. NPDC049002]|uniref:AAA family ATPase n=1 Tax=unclassified Sphaerisporangium TaxID=2630420 RepID=UPI0033E40A35